MTNPMNADETLLKMAEALGLGASDLMRVAAHSKEGTKVPTVAEFFDVVVSACSEKSLPTYLCHFKHLRGAHADDRLDHVTTTQLEKLRDEISGNAAAEKVERAVATGRTLRSYELDAHGHGAGENAVRAFRFFFRTAVRSRIISVNPAMDVQVPKGPPVPERPLTIAELEERWRCTGAPPVTTLSSTRSCSNSTARSAHDEKVGSTSASAT